MAESHQSASLFHPSQVDCYQIVHNGESMAGQTPAQQVHMSLAGNPLVLLKNCTLIKDLFLPTINSITNPLKIFLVPFGFLWRDLLVETLPLQAGQLLYRHGLEHVPHQGSHGCLHLLGGSTLLLLL